MRVKSALASFKSLQSNELRKKKSDIKVVYFTGPAQIFPALHSIMDVPL